MLAHWGLGNVYYGPRRSVADARDHYQKVLDLDPDFEKKEEIQKRLRDTAARDKGKAVPDEQARLTRDEQFVLAQLYHNTGRWPQAQEVMLELLAKYPEDARFAATYIRMLMRHKATAELIRPWVTRLEKLEPTAVQLLIQVLQALSTKR